MTYTVPTTQADGNLIDATDWNTDLVDNIKHLAGDNRTLIPGGRLTLTSGTPVTTSDVTGAGTLYYATYRHNVIYLYSGTAWLPYTFTERSLALTLTSGLPYDVFIYDNSGTLTLEVLAWTNTTTRATALITQDGVYVKSGATTRRYLGTIYASGTNAVDDSLALRGVWNYYNRVERPMLVKETTDSWTYTTAAFRAANGSAANALAFVIGVNETPVWASVDAIHYNANAAGYGTVGIGLDSTSTNSATQIIGPPTNSVINSVHRIAAYYDGYPGVGYHKLTWLEYSLAAGTSNWSGDAGAPTLYQTAIIGRITA